MREISINDVWNGFVALMDKAESKEEDFHRYMVQYPSLIPIWKPYKSTIFSKFRLGSQHVTEFAFARDDTPGFRWHFVEIERPQDRLFTKSGNPTARLAHALRQVHDWDAWFQENRDHVQKYFPFSDRVKKFGLAEPHLTLIMGRREQIEAFNVPLVRRFGGAVSIRSFDSLRSNLLTAWVHERDKPLRCCALTNKGEEVLSTMWMDIRFQVD